MKHHVCLICEGMGKTYKEAEWRNCPACNGLWSTRKGRDLVKRLMKSGMGVYE